MRIHHLNCATLCPPFAALTQGSGGWFERGRMVCHCLLVESKAGLLLIDTGLGTADIRAPKQRLGGQFVVMTAPRCDPAETALAQLRARGFSPSDLRHVLPTHLDVDHAGGLADFPDAQVHVLGREHDAAMTRRTFPERQRYRPCQWEHSPKWRIHEPTAGERWFGFESVRPLAGTDDEVLIIPLYGHTRGHAGVAVRGEHGWLLHAGDAYFHHDSVYGTGKNAPPGLLLFEKAVQTDAGQRVHNRDRLRELAAQHQDEVRIICAHDPGELASSLSVA